MRKVLDIIIIILLLVLFCLHSGKFFGKEVFSNQAKQQPEATTEDGADDGAPVSLDEAKSIFTDATSLASMGKGVFEVKAGGKTIGFVMKSSPYSDGTSGFMGPIPLLIGLDKESRIFKVIALKNDETPQFFELVTKAGILDSWNGMLPKEVAGKKVDAVTGATYSSKGIIGSMQARMAAMDEIQPPKPMDWNALVSNVCFILLVILSMVGFFKPRLIGKGRIALLAASVVILAFWQGRMLSMAQFMVWLVNGIPLAAQWCVALLFLLSIALPMAFGRAYYCAWVCPMGAAQELLGTINKKHKVRLGASLLQWLQLIRTAVLLGVLLAMGLGLSFGFQDFEAFTVFHPGSAPKAALAIGVVSLVASLWIPRPWCRFLCPLGELLETLRRQK